MNNELKITSEISITPALESSHCNYMRRFSQTRRMKRNPVRLVQEIDKLRLQVGLPLGPQGEFYTGSQAEDGEDCDHWSVIDFRKPPDSQPSLWCDWCPSKDGSKLVWHDRESESEVVLFHWLCFIQANFLLRWGYVATGVVSISVPDPEHNCVITIDGETISIVHDRDSKGELPCLAYRKRFDPIELQKSSGNQKRQKS